MPAAAACWAILADRSHGGRHTGKYPGVAASLFCRGLNLRQENEDTCL